MFGCNHFKVWRTNQWSRILEGTLGSDLCAMDRCKLVICWLWTDSKCLMTSWKVPCGQYCWFTGQFFFLEILHRSLSGSEWDFHLFFGIDLGSPPFPFTLPPNSSGFRNKFFLEMKHYRHLLSTCCVVLSCEVSLLQRTFPWSGARSEVGRETHMCLKLPGSALRRYVNESSCGMSGPRKGAEGIQCGKQVPSDGVSQ